MLYLIIVKYGGIMETLENIIKKNLQFLSSFSKDEIGIKTKEEKAQRGFLEFSGMWKERDITLESLREEAWRK